MSRKKISPVTLVIATRNAHKVSEIKAMLGANFICASLNEFPGAPGIVENANTFAGNATKKAVELARWLAAKVPTLNSQPSTFVLADDSGLEVDALHGAPGVHSARFAALEKNSGNSSDAENNAKLLRLLENVPRETRTARFRCVLALVQLDTQNSRLETSSPVCYADEFELQTQIFDGTCEGRIDFTPRGRGGFGYDPLFIPNGFEKSFAELGEETKNQISHRAQALAKLVDWLKVES